MALFNFGKKKEIARPVRRDIESIQVLGSGCKACHTLFEATKEAAQNLDLKLEVEYITDMEKIMAFGVMRMPALAVNGKVVSMGKVLKPAEIKTLLKGSVTR